MASSAGQILTCAEAYERYKKAKERRGMHLFAPLTCEVADIVEDVLLGPEDDAIRPDKTSVDYGPWHSAMKTYSTRLRRVVDSARDSSRNGSNLHTALKPLLTEEEHQRFKGFYTFGMDSTPGSQCSQASSSSYNPSQEVCAAGSQPHGPSFKPLEDVSQKRRRERTDSIFKMLVDFAEENQVEMDVLLGHLGKRYYYHSNREKAKVFDTLSQGKNPLAPRKIDPELALFLRDCSNLGRRTYTNQRLLLAPYCNWPTHQELNSIIQKVVPKLSPFLGGVKASLSDVVQKTVSRLM